MLEFQKLGSHIRGLTQHVQHNGRLADPMDPIVIEMKKITSLHHSKKTPELMARLADLEFEGGLYLDSQGRVCVPGSTIEGAMYEAGKKKSKGPQVRSGLISQGDWPLIYKGPKSVEGLKKDPEFRSRVGIVNPSTGGRSMRVRPVFRIWELKFEMTYNPGIIGRDMVVELLKILGSQIGLSDDRTKMGGRFEVVEIKDIA